MCRISAFFSCSFSPSLSLLGIYFCLFCSLSFYIRVSVVRFYGLHCVHIPFVFQCMHCFTSCIFPYIACDFVSIHFFVQCFFFSSTKRKDKNIEVDSVTEKVVAILGLQWKSSCSKIRANPLINPLEMCIWNSKSSNHIWLVSNKKKINENFRVSLWKWLSQYSEYLFPIPLSYFTGSARLFSCSHKIFVHFIFPQKHTYPQLHSVLRSVNKNVQTFAHIPLQSKMIWVIHFCQTLSVDLIKRVNVNITTTIFKKRAISTAKAKPKTSQFL